MKKSISEDNLTKLSQTIEMLLKTGKIIEPILEKLSEKDVDLFTFTILNFLERFNSTVHSVEILLNTFLKTPSVETSIGLIVRSSLLDFMTITYLVSYQADIKEESDIEGRKKVDERLHAIHADQLKYTFKYFRDAKNSGLITPDEYKTAIESTRHNYPFLFTTEPTDFERPERQLISTSSISTADIFKRIQSHFFTKRFAAVYDNFQWYSKYEHFGIMTHYMQRIEIDELLQSLWVSIKYINIGIGVALAYLSTPQESFDEEIKEFNLLMDRYNIDV